MSRFNFQKAKQLVDATGMKRRVIADRMDLMHGTLNHYLNGHGRPGRDAVEKLAELLGVPLEELWNSEAPEAPASVARAETSSVGLKASNS